MINRVYPFQILSITLSLIFLMNTSGYAQSNIPMLEKSTLEVIIKFIASDELQGRKTGEPGVDISAKFIATHFDAWELQEFHEMGSYFQEFQLEQTFAPEKAFLRSDSNEWIQQENLMIVNGLTEDTLTTNAVFAKYGWVDSLEGRNDYQDLDVEDKIVFVISGTPNSRDPGSSIRAIPEKMRFAKENGALGLIELYQLPFPWRTLTNFFRSSSFRFPEKEENDPLIYGWINESDPGNIPALISKNNENSVSLYTSGEKVELINAKNVIGWVAGTDPDLKEEFIIVGAHYDHLGVAPPNSLNPGSRDSVFNGARDNAIGVAALLTAAYSLSKQPAARPVLFVAFTAEEIGLLGSQYFVNNTTRPLSHFKYMLNFDGGGYTDTTLMAITGWGRTQADTLLEKGAHYANLQTIGNPAPEQKLYQRSDNINLSKKGIPSATISPGFTAFSEELLHYYHQLSDRPESLNYSYIYRYCKAAAHMVHLISNTNQPIYWVEGDPFKSTGDLLYKKP